MLKLYLSLAIILLLQPAYSIKVCQGDLVSQFNQLIIQCSDPTINLAESHSWVIPANLTSDCRNVTYGSVYGIMEHWRHDPIDNSTILGCCDYYDLNRNYKYSFCDNDIGVVVPEVGSTPYSFYLTQNQLGLNMTQLMNQISGQCQNAVAPFQSQQPFSQEQPSVGSAPGAGVIFDGQNMSSMNLITNLNLPYQQWIQDAQQLPEVINWNIDKWRDWINRYTQYLNTAYQQQLGNITGQIQELVDTQKQKIQELVNSIVNINVFNIPETNSSQESTNATLPSGGNIWQPQYDNLTVQQLQNRLDQENVLRGFVDWYNTFFPYNVSNQTAANQTQSRRFLQSSAYSQSSTTQNGQTNTITSQSPAGANPAIAGTSMVNGQGSSINGIGDISGLTNFPIGNQNLNDAISSLINNANQAAQANGGNSATAVANANSSPGQGSQSATSVANSQGNGQSSGEQNTSGQQTQQPSTPPVTQPTQQPTTPIITPPVQTTPQQPTQSPVQEPQQQPNQTTQVPPVQQPTEQPTQTIPTVPVQNETSVGTSQENVTQPSTQPVITTPPIQTQPSQPNINIIPPQSIPSSFNNPIVVATTPIPALQNLLNLINSFTQNQLNLVCPSATSLPATTITQPQPTTPSPSGGFLTGQPTGSGVSIDNTPDSQSDSQLSSGIQTLIASLNNQDYQLPQNCQYSGTDKICCSQFINSGCFTFSSIKQFLRTGVQPFCSAVNQYYNNCFGIMVCYQGQVFMHYFSRMLFESYIWLYFDNKAAESLYNICDTEYPAMSLGEVMFLSGFNYLFGTLNM